MNLPARRTVMPVPRDKFQESVRFYQHVLGMRVFYDQVLEASEGQLLGVPAPAKAHLVSLQQGDSTLGMVGFVEYLEPEVEVPTLSRPPGVPFPLGFVFHVDDLEAAYARAVEIGAEVLSPPRVYGLPERGKMRAAFLLDPNGVSVELTQVL